MYVLIDIYIDRNKHVWVYGITKSACKDKSTANEPAKYLLTLSCNTIQPKSGYSK